jgi:UPF0716 protein FxsA
MKRWPLVGLLLIPLADLALLVVVAQFISWVPTVALVVLTALLGLLFVRAEGRHTLSRIQNSLVQGELPTNEVIDGGLLIAAGAFLLTPGFVTDIVGVILALPLTRIPLRMALKRYVIVPYADSKTDGFVTGEVYTFGFPEDVSTGRGSPSGTGGTGGSGDHYDLGPDAYDVEFDDETDESQ